MPRLVCGTRGSPLALWQARHAAALLRALDPELEIHERIVTTQGDLDVEAPISLAAEHGVFVRGLERALLAGQIDLAVHSLKDLPSDQPEGLCIAAVLERHDPRDALLSEAGWTLQDLPPRAVVGTGSARRRTQLLSSRPDLRIAPVRGNVDTRVRKLLAGEFDAIVLALAGVQRLGLDRVAVCPLDPSACLPAVGQGALAIETRAADLSVRERVEALSHPPTLVAVGAERAFLKRLGGGCLAPATAFGRIVGGGRLELEAMVGDTDGRVLLIEREAGPVSSAAAIGERLAERLLAAGGDRLLREARQQAPRADGPS